MTDKTGTVGWIDTTVEDADGLRDFYASVTGLVPEPVSMGEYNDYNMTQPDSGTPIAGICHARGGNAEIPPGWLIYFMVDDLDDSVERAEAGGGKVLVGPKGLAGGRFAVIEDPAGGVAAIYEA